MVPPPMDERSVVVNTIEIRLRSRLDSVCVCTLKDLLEAVNVASVWNP